MSAPVTLSDTQVENHEMVVTMHQQYKADYIAALRNASKIQRDLSRAEHEANRIARQIERIEAFCQKHGVALEEEL